MIAKDRRTRDAFTTIELLTVIAIIAVLMALTTAGVMKVKTAANRAKAANEAGQLASAIGVFQREKHVNYIPSVIVLRERMDYNQSNTVEVESANYLKQVWPQAPLVLSAGGGSSPYPNGTVPGLNGIDWNGDGVIAAPNTAWLLEGDQCLVFFLGGVPSPGTGGLRGFSSNPRNPADATNTKQYFEFATKNLKLRAAAAYNGFNTYTATDNNALNAAGAVGFPSYTDPFGSKPYVFFSAFNRKNGYRPFIGAPTNVHDCGTLTGTTFVPYGDTAASFHQPTGFQIISAGYDKLYGGGGITGGNTGAGTPDGDNITNFSNGQISGLSN